MIQLHRLIRAEADEIDRADRLRSTMSDCTVRMSPEEQDRIGGISGDLYAIVDDEVFIETDDEEQSKKVLNELTQAVGESRWASVIELLRYRPSDSPWETVNAGRSLAYGMLGHYNVALEFIEEGLKRNSESVHFRYQLLWCLGELNLTYQAIQRAKSFHVSGVDDLYWIIKLADVLASYSPVVEQPELRRQYFSSVVNFFNQVFMRKSDFAALEPRLRSNALARLGLCLDMVDLHVEAACALEAALQSGGLSDIQREFILERTKAVRASAHKDINRVVYTNMDINAFKLSRPMYGVHRNQLRVPASEDYGTTVINASSTSNRAVPSFGLDDSLALQVASLSPQRLFGQAYHACVA